jgi:RNA polymerase sigma-70 factor (ECF subfamily)
MAEAILPLADRRSFEEALATHYDPLVRRLALIVRDFEEAKDLAQAAYLKAYERRRDFKGGDARAWLFTIGIRLALNEVRRRRRWREFVQRGARDDSWAIESDPDLWAALGRLERRNRAVVILHLLDGYTQHEIAEALGVPSGTVASWLSRAKAKLRTSLSGESHGSI